MDIWNTLGIKPTTDKTEIKRAYAAAAKQYHPEEHPQEYLKIQNAYKAAMRFASSYNGHPDNEEIKTEQQETKQQKTEQQDTEQTDTEQSYTKQPGSDQKSNSVQTESEIHIVMSVSADSKTDSVEDLDSYDFENINSTPDEDETALLKKEFWNEFYAIIWHPYIRNSKMVWEYLFTNSRYTKLISEPDFSDMFMWNLCAFDNIWNVFTVRYINRKIDQSRSDPAKFMPVSAWSDLMHIEPARDILMFKKCCTKKEKRLFKNIWKKENRKIFKNKNKMTEYLKSYFLYISDKKDIFEEVFRNSVSARRKQAKMAVAIAVISVFAVLGLSVSDLSFMDITKTDMYVEYKYNRPDDTEKEETEREFDYILKTYNDWLSEKSK